MELDSGFVSALQSLNVAPSPAGTATVNNGVATFPITGGNVTVYKPGTTVKLSDGAASALNKAFSTDALKGGTTVGIATIIVKLSGQGQAQARRRNVVGGRRSRCLCRTQAGENLEFQKLAPALS